MKTKFHLPAYLLVSGFLFAFDQLLKYLARASADFSYYLWKPWLGWEYYANPGIAFSIPCPNWLIILFTPLIILVLIFWIIKSFKEKKSISYHLSFIIIIAGALSNYIDRILFSATIDYLRFFTGVINLADVMIAGGVVMIFVCCRKGYNKTNKEYG